MAQKENIIKLNTMTPPLISVVVPCYNQGEFLKECISSVLSQTYKNIEIIIVDDGSTDSSPDVVNEQCKRHGCISCHHILRSGVSAARNFGISNAAGDLILPLDADDLIRKEFLSETIIPLSRNIGDIIYTDIEFFGEKTGIKRMGKYNYNKFAIKNQMANTSLFKKEHWKEVGGYNETFLDGYEDWEFWINICEKCNARGYYIPKPLLLYRIKKDSRNKEAKRKEDSIWKKITELHPQFVRYEEIKR